MNKSRKKLLMSSMAMLLVSAMALSTATFAWFTSSDKGTVTDIEFTAKAAQGIQLSANAVDWKTTLPIGEIQTAQAATANFAEKLSPLSTKGAVASGAMPLYNGTIGADGKMTGVTEPTTGDFYRFDVYVKNDGNTAQTLYLDLAGSTVVDKADAESDPAKLNTGISKAVRLAFIDQKQGDKTGTEQTAESVIASLQGTTSVIWEPNAASHNSYATTYRYKLGTDGKPTTTKIVASSDIEKYVALTAATEGDASLSVMAGAAIPGTGAEYFTAAVTDASGTVKIAELPANMVTKLTIYLWIEGQDVDCNNAESGGTVLTNLSFTTTAASSSGGDTPPSTSN